jgi:hypothetical protein
MKSDKNKQKHITKNKKGTYIMFKVTKNKKNNEIHNVTPGGLRITYTFPASKKNHRYELKLGQGKSVVRLTGSQVGAVLRVLKASENV